MKRIIGTGKNVASTRIAWNNIIIIEEFIKINVKHKYKNIYPSNHAG